MNDPTSNDSAMRGASKRWTPKILDRGGGFTPVANLFIENYAKLDPPLTPAEAMLVIHIMKEKWDRKPVTVSSETLAVEMNLTGGQVRQKLRVLETKGVLDVQSTKGKSKQYDFMPLLIKLEALIVEQPQDEEEDEKYFQEIERRAEEQRAAQQPQVIAPPKTAQLKKPPPKAKKNSGLREGNTADIADEIPDDPF